MNPVQPFANAVIVLLPVAFGFNAETAESNAFVSRPADPAGVASLARREIEVMARALVDAGVHVELWQDTPTPPRPDAPFVNNWLSTHRDGRIFIYPMATPSRRAEIRKDLVASLRDRFQVSKVIDWSHEATAGRALEGTGSLVIDTPEKRRVFACRSPRTDAKLAAAWAAKQSLELVLFTAQDPSNAAIYHTNVLLSLAAGISLCGLSQIPTRERHTVAAALHERGPVIELTAEQLDAFAGNMLQLIDRNGSPLLVLSTTALAALLPAQRRSLERQSALLPVSIPTVEAVGGGSARCLLAEIFLPAQAPS